MIAAVGGERNELQNNFYTVYHVAQGAGSGGLSCPIKNIISRLFSTRMSRLRGGRNNFVKSGEVPHLVGEMMNHGRIHIQTIPAS